MYSDEPVLGSVMSDIWSASEGRVFSQLASRLFICLRGTNRFAMLNLVYDRHENAAKTGCTESKKMCEEWVNISSFFA